MRDGAGYLILILTFLLAAGISFLPPPAAAQENYYNPGKLAAEKESAGRETPKAGNAPETTQYITVTSIQKCYERLDRKDALEIQRGYTKPYQECRRRLSLKLQKEQGHKAGEPPGAIPDKPRNFYQVQKTPLRPTKDEAGDGPKKNRVFVDRNVPLN